VDQRRTLRITTDLPARCRSAARFVIGRVRNVSQGGIMFLAATHEPSPPSGDVAMEIDLPDGGAPLTLEGEICWRADIGATGIRITKIPLAHRRRLANWILRAHHGAGDSFAD
jgi:hypothetical protein